MPQIDTYTATTKPVVPDQPLRFMETGEAEGARLVAQAERFGHNLAEVAGHINEQASNLEWMQAKGARDNKNDQVVLDLSNDAEVIANPSLFIEKYRQQMKDFDIAAAANFKHKEAAAHYSFYRETQGGQEDIKAQAFGLKMQANKNKGDFLIEKNRLSNQAAAAPTGEEFNANVELFQRLVTTSVQNKALTPKEGEQEMIAFRQVTAERNMEVIGDRDPALFHNLLMAGRWPDSLVPADKKVKIVEHVNTQAHVLSQRQQEVFTKQRTLYKNGREAEANYGRLTQAEIDNGRRGLDPLLPDPSAWNILAKLNEEAPGNTAGDAGGMRRIDAIRLAVGLNPKPSRATAEAGLAAIEEQRALGGLSPKAMAHAIATAEHFQGYIKSLDALELSAKKYDTSQTRADKAEAIRDENQEYTREKRQVDKAMTYYDSVVKPPVVANPMLEKQARFKRNQFREMMTKNPGMDPKDAITAINGQIKEYEQQKSAIDRLLETQPVR